MTHVRILIAEDQPLYRDALAALLLEEPGFELVAVAGDAAQAISLAEATHPDVAIVDVKMPGGGGPKATRGILRCSPSSNVVALSGYDDRASVLAMFHSGALGYLVKDIHAEGLVQAIRGIADGQGVLSSEVTASVIEELTGKLRQDSSLAERRARLARRVRRAVSNGQLKMHFQPIFTLRSNRVVGVEALARFTGPPVRGPLEWFEEAESVGLRVDLELAAASRAFAEIGEIPPGAYMAVNLSAPTAVSDLFLDLLDRVPASRVVVEVTEHSPVEDYDTLNEAMGLLRDRGVRLAIDDAGAGFASLRHIVRLDPEIIKLDNSLTRGIDRDVKRRALASALIAFAEKIGAGIVAEGIETREECQQLRSLGAGCGQGYFLATPGPLPVKAA